MPWEYQWDHDKVLIYHLLSSSFGQCIPVSQVVDFNVANVIAILGVDITGIFLLGRRCLNKY